MCIQARQVNKIDIWIHMSKTKSVYKILESKFKVMNIKCIVVVRRIVFEFLVCIFVSKTAL